MNIGLNLLSVVLLTHYDRESSDFCLNMEMSYVPQEERRLICVCVNAVFARGVGGEGKLWWGVKETLWRFSPGLFEVALGERGEGRGELHLKADLGSVLFFLPLMVNAWMWGRETCTLISAHGQLRCFQEGWVGLLGIKRGLDNDIIDLDLWIIYLHRKIFHWVHFPERI